MTEKVRAVPIVKPAQNTQRCNVQRTAHAGLEMRARAGRAPLPVTVQRALGNHGMSLLLARNPPKPHEVANPTQIAHAAIRHEEKNALQTSTPTPSAQEIKHNAPHQDSQPLKVNPPGDQHEQAADALATRVMQSTGAAERVVPGPPIQQIEARITANTHSSSEVPGTSEAPSVPAQTATFIRNPGAGHPLPAVTRSRIEPHLAADLGVVRVHSGPSAASAALTLGARAFTHANDIFLGAGESMHDTRLMAHEATHVVQQRRDSATGDSATGAPDVQRGLIGSIGSGLASAAGAVYDVGAGAVNTVGQVASDVAGDVVNMGVDYFWSLLERYAPRFVPILREIGDKGILGYFADMIRNTFGSIFDSLAADPGVIGTLTATFLDLFGRAQTILAALATGDCQPLFAAMTQLKETVSQMAGDAWNAISEFFQPVGDFFSNLWQQFGAPLVDWLSAMAGDVWQWIQDLGAQIWAWTQPVRDTLGAAWTWIKEQLFGHDDAQGNSEGGLVNWITDMAGRAWDAIKTELEPVIAPIRSFAESVMALLPLDAILNLRETVQGWLSNVQNMTQNMSQPQDVAANQSSLREILPGVLASIATLRDGIVGAGQWVAAQVGSVADAVSGFFASLSGVSLLSPLSGAISWVQETVSSLSSWAQETVAGLFTSIGDGLVYLSQFIEPIVTMLQQLVSVVTDLLGVLPNFIAGIWNRIPACIREPIQKFIVDNILSQIPIFAQILQIPDIWARISQTVMTILRQVFVDGNLAGAAWTFFQALLSVLGIPPELVVNIISKAATALSDILRDPVGFFLNLLRAVKQGFINFFGNIAGHLLRGVTAWLFDELQRANIRPPQDLSLRSIVGFVLEVLGISVDNFFERLGRRIGPDRAQRIRRIFNTITGALSWVIRLINEGPGALWEEIQSQISNLWQMVLNGVIGWLNREIIERATVRLLSMLDPTGIMAVVNSLLALYNAIQSVVQYIRQILEVVNTVLDGIGGIARGAIEQAAGFLESGLVRILPIAIGFLANQVGLSGLGRRISEMIETVRGYVNQGIDWLINSSINAFNALFGRGEEQAPPGTGTQTAGDLLEPVTLGPEQHTLRVHVEADGSTTLMMASDNWNTFPAVIGRIRDTYAGSLRDQGENTKANELVSQLNGLIGEAESTKTQISTQNLAAYRRGQRTNMPVAELWPPALERFDSELNRIATEFGFDQVQPGVVFNIGDEFSDLASNNLMVVRSVMAREESRFGIRARPKAGGNEVFYNYLEYGRVWERVARPGFVGFHIVSGRKVGMTFGYPLSAAGRGSVNFPVPGYGTTSSMGNVFNRFGHLIADMFGGPVSANNIVALTENANNGQMLPYEMAVQRDIISVPTNLVVYEYDVEPIFGNGPNAAPTQIIIVARKKYPVTANPSTVPATRTVSNV